MKKVNTFETNYKNMKLLLEELEKNKDNLDKSLEIYSKARSLYNTLNKQIEDYKAKIEIIDSGKDE